MEGIIKIYFEDKQFGFIIDDNNNEYFFHKSKIQSNENKKIDKDFLVLFDFKETKKGLTAENIRITKKKHKAIIKYIEPDDIYITKYQNIKNWDTLFKSDYTIHMTDKGNPNDIKDNLKYIASKIGANCILELTYNSEEGSEPGTGSGTHYFTVHHYSGRFAFIAKKSSHGNTIDKNTISQIDNNLLKQKENIEKEYSANSLYGTILFIGFIGASLYFITENKEFNWVSLIIPLMIFGTLAGYINSHTKCWIDNS